MELKHLLVCAVLMAVAIVEIAGKPSSQIAALDKQMTAKATVKKDAVNTKTKIPKTKIDPLVEPASGAKVEIIKDDSVQLEDVQDTRPSPPDTLCATILCLPPGDSSQQAQESSDAQLEQILDDSPVVIDAAKTEVKKDEATVEAAVEKQVKKSDEPVKEEKDDKVNQEAKEQVDGKENDQAEDETNEQEDDGKEKRSLNSYRSNFAYACPNGRAISTLYSSFHPSFRDRQWGAKCDKLLPSRSTGPRFWSTNQGYDNELKGYLNAYCPPQSVMSGLAGYWHQGSYDRRFKLFCTHVWHHKKTSCKWSPWMNNWRESSHFTLGCNTGYYVVGFNSVYSKTIYDRRFRVYMCKLQKI